MNPGPRETARNVAYCATAVGWLLTNMAADKIETTARRVAVYSDARARVAEHRLHAATGMENPT